MVQAKAKKERSLNSVLGGTLLVVIIGLVLGFFIEAQRSPEFVKSRSAVEKSDNKISPTFRLGNTQNASSLTRLIEGVERGSASNRSIELNEGDLNAIADQYFNFTLGKQHQLASGEDPTYGFFPDTPNFALDDGKLQIAIPFEVILFQLKGKAYLILTGHFNETQSEPSFVVEDAWINSARLPAFAGNFLLNRLAKTVSSLSSDSPVVAAWSQFGSARIDGNEMVIEPRQ